MRISPPLQKSAKHLHILFYFILFIIQTRNTNVNKSAETCRCRTTSFCSRAILSGRRSFRPVTSQPAFLHDWGLNKDVLQLL
jgi:hypothetical protein